MISKLLKDKRYEIILQGREVGENRKKTFNSVLWADNWSQDIIYKLFLIFQGVLEDFSILEKYKDRFSYICRFLYLEFHREIDEDKKIDFENALDERIKKLEEFRYTTSKGLDQKYKRVITFIYHQIILNKMKVKINY